MSIDIKYVTADDWEGLYVGDELVEENHSLRVFDVLERLQYTHIGSFMAFSVNDEWLQSEGSLPRFFSEIPEEMLD